MPDAAGPWWRSPRANPPRCASGRSRPGRRRSRRRRARPTERSGAPPGSTDGNTPDRPRRGFRNGDGEDAVFQVGFDAFHLDRLGERERPRETAVAALDAMILLARNLAAGAGGGAGA